MCEYHRRPALDRRTLLKTGAAAGVAAWPLAATVTPARAGTPGARVTPELTQGIISEWPKSALTAAKATIEKYGQPNEATASLLLWHNNGPWKRTIVYREEVDHFFPVPHKDVIEQFISYQVSPDKFDELAEYDGSVVVARTWGEMSARCHMEAANFLALNLAHDIVTGKRNVVEAREFYVDAIKQMAAGNTPEYMQKLLFEVSQDYAGDPDVAAM